VNSIQENLTDAQNELYGWIKDYVKTFQHSPSIRQMMEAMGLKSPAPIQSRLKHLQEKGYISWQEGKARTLKLVEDVFDGVPIMGSIAAGGLIETFSDVNEKLDISEILQKKGIFALTVNGDSMEEACITEGDMVLMKPIENPFDVRNGDIVSALVPGSGTTLKYFFKKNDNVVLEAANPKYDPITLPADQVVIQGKLLAVWRKI
tara:strand:- start:2088 stop:2702 length:615 start_codon:yes stop_codon:yes gene_type:complete